MIEQASVHCCLVADNLAANLMPLLDQRLRPETVVLIHSAAQQEQAKGLEQVLQSLPELKVVSCLLAAPDCMASVRHALVTLLEDYRGQVVALNASGGERLVALVAYEWFRAAGNPVFYVNTVAKQLHVFMAEAAPYQLAEQPSLEQYCLSRGFTLRQSSMVAVSEKQRAFAQELVANIRHYSAALTSLNWLAASAGKNLHSRPVESWHMASRTFIELLDRLRDLELAQMQAKCLVFADAAARHFVNGGWLEDYAYTTLQAMHQSGRIQCPTAGLVLESADTQHELDLGFVCQNRVHLIECRARKLKKGNARSGAEVVLRTDELHQLSRGLQAYTLLLSYCPLRDVDVRRLQLMGIRVLQEKQLQNLHYYLDKWLTDQV